MSSVGLIRVPTTMVYVNDLFNILSIDWEGTQLMTTVLTLAFVLICRFDVHLA